MYLIKYNCNEYLLKEQRNPVLLFVKYSYLLKNEKVKIDKIGKINWNKNKIENSIADIIYNSFNLVNISNKRPISRSYFKLRQILYDFNLVNKFYDNIACIAEGPGGL